MYISTYKNTYTYIYIQELYAIRLQSSESSTGAHTRGKPSEDARHGMSSRALSLSYSLSLSLSI
jgi:hypothetical protein